MKKYIVTGGAGFIGSRLIDALLSKGDSVLVIDNLLNGKKKNINPKAEFVEADICDFQKIKTYFKNIDGVFHLAAIPRIPLSIEDPIGTFKTNVQGTVSVFKAAIDADVKRVVFASSSSVYGNQNKLPLVETMVPNPISPYGLQKLMAEQIAKMFVGFYKIPIVCLRYFNVYGPGLDFASNYSLVIGKFLALKKQGKPLTIFGSGNQSRGFCFIDDVADGNIKAMESSNIKGGEVINIGQKESCSINFIANFIGGPVEYLPPRLGDPVATQADIAFAKKVLGWEPKIEIKEGLRRTIDWYEKQ